MKKLSFSFLLMLGLMTTIFFACKDDDDDPEPVPTITSLTPNTGAVGVQVVIAGTNFGTSPTVKFGTTDATVASANATSITTTVPAGLAAGAVNVTVTANGQTSAASTFTVAAPTETPTIANTLADIADLSTLAAALEATGLTDALNAEGPFTLFAPNNDAFTALLEALALDDLPAVIEALGEEAIAQTLQAHVVGDSITSAEIAAGDLTTINDSTITVTVEGETVLVNGAAVVQADIIAGNGVIHIIDSVINLPPVQSGETIRVAPSAEGVGTVTWTANNTYILDGFIYVNEGQTLTIEPGTVIKGKAGQGSEASALIVARGGMIMAEGTAEAPIIFTGEADDLNGSVPEDANALWGGVIILGRATNNNTDVSGVKNIEGIPTEETRGQYGGEDDADNSGVFSYVSIRHGGSLIGSDNEINGLTLGSVGSGTVINNVEILSNLDDGVEFFGGTVNVTNLVISYPGDDGIDVDEGYRGNIQNAIVWHTGETLQSDDPRGMELDGGVDANETAQPFATPKMANLTLLYDDADGVNVSDAVYMRDNFGGSIYNSILYGYDAPIDMERLTTLDESSYDRYVAGDIVISGNILYNINAVTDPANFADLFELSNEGDATLEGEVETALAEANTVVDPTFGTGATKFTPTAEAVTTGLVTELPTGVQALSYKGAVDPAGDAYFANWSRTWFIINQ